MMQVSMDSLRWHIGLAASLLVAGIAIALIGAFQSDLIGLLPSRHLRIQLGLVVLTGGSGALLAWLAGISLAAGLAIVWLILLFLLAGPLPVLAASGLALAAGALGHRLFCPDPVVGRPAVSVVLGLGLLAGSLGWLLAFPIHNAWVYLVGLGSLVYLSRSHWPGSLAELSAWLAPLRQPRPIAAAFAVMSLGLASMSLWLPSLMYDDLAYHLGLAAQLDRWAYYRMDAGSQVWALAPWAGSILHGTIWLLAGDAARGGLNALWLILTAVLLWRVGSQLGLSERLRWWALAIHGSLPLSFMLGAGLHMESPSIAVALALVSLTLEVRDRPSASQLLACAVLMGFLIALKASNVLLVAPIGLWMLLRWGRKMPWRWVLPCAMLALFLAGSSYFHAWFLTGNPFLPLYNDLFESPFYPIERFSDQRWQTGFGLALPWQLTFSTERYFEGWAGAAGLVWIALLGLVPLALLHKVARPLALVGLAAVILPLFMIQYLRYAHPGFVLLLPALLLGLQRLPAPAVNSVLGLLVVVNLAFHGNAHWALRDGAVMERLLNGRESLEQRLVPELAMARWVEQQDLGQARILLIDPDRPYHARFAGQAFSRVWYDPALVGLAWAADQDPSGRQWQQMWRDHGITHVLTVGELPPGWSGALGAAQSIQETGTARLWRLDIEAERDLMHERDLARRLWPQVLVR